MNRLPIDRERTNPLGDRGNCLDLPAVTPDPDHVAVLDAFFFRECLANLNERLWLDDGVGLDVLGPEVEVLGQTIGRRRVWKLIRFSER